MDRRLEKSSGVAIIIGSVFMVLTMVLHPTGGDAAHIRQMSDITIASHSLAILSIIVLSYGMVGLAIKLKSDIVLSYGGAVLFAFSAVAVMMAATLNGLAVPFFLERMGEITSENNDMIRAVLIYNYSLNKAFDLVFILALSGAAILWSWAIVRTGLLKKWLGFLGLVVGILAIAMTLFGFVFTDLQGLRIFIGAFVVWLVAVGVALARRPATLQA
ncbi:MULTISPECIES: hypothetical protein [unclassified Imperialibacter]|uniref:hypothetical protein n=1 Tax=unclassified Imperialibacter TaxID=2629706 RepID=UPI001257A3F4|nr:MULTISPECIES: hypothetical protein [unclassified Imperialibacter]CAD5277727.1 conserved membrane hypothetical protein [Imperialibacter sp. 75]CAD5295586.1 conserved membrane hypothetical protein [Imperialibacter sp. 89]VVT11936.1 conserved membrane hypothetical protein [Imperialibacter sp. EC-SDR9]